MSLEKVDILLEKLEYWPGDEVAGIVVVKVSETIRSQGISLNLKGEATVEILKEGGSSATTENSQDCENSENYFSYETFLVSNGQKEVTLKDEFWCPFSFQLPDSLVNSFNQANGKVTYYFELRLKQSGKPDNIITKSIPVHTNVDLSTIPEAARPCQWKASKSFKGCLCCSKGSLKMYVRLLRQGFLFGETIPFEVELSNVNKKKRNDVSAQLLQVTTFHGRGHAKNERSVVSSEVKRGEESTNGESVVWRGDLEVPPEGVVFPTNLGGCSIIDLEYFLMVTAHVKGRSSDLKVVCRIIIGTCRSEPVTLPDVLPLARPIGYKPLEKQEEPNRNLDVLFESTY